jgi:hypothetical protein
VDSLENQRKTSVGNWVVRSLENQRKTQIRITGSERYEEPVDEADGELGRGGEDVLSMPRGSEETLYDQIANQLALPTFTRTIQGVLPLSSPMPGQMSREFQDRESY